MPLTAGSAPPGQGESRNISENIRRGIQRKFEKGDTFTKYKNFMGYDCFDGEIVIVPEQAEVVRKIFDLYLQEEMAKRSRFVREGKFKGAGADYISGAFDFIYRLKMK